MSLKKALLFWMVAFLFVGMANAAIDGKKFCVTFYNAYGEFHISQQDEGYVPSDADEHCVSEWGSIDDVDDDQTVAYYLQQHALDITSFRFDSDLDLGGYTENADGSVTCKEKFFPIQMPATSDGVYLLGNYHTIENFCYIVESTTPADGNPPAGFAVLNGKTEIENLYFNNAYVESKEGAAGLLTAALGNSRVYDVKIYSSTVKGTAAGLISGVVSLTATNNYFSSVSAYDSKVTGSVLAGGLVGQLNGNGWGFSISSDVLYHVDVVGSGENAIAGGAVAEMKNCSVEFTRVDIGQNENGTSSVSVTAAGNTRAGGLVGRVLISNNDIVNVTETSVKANVSGASLMGGMVGLVEGSSVAGAADLPIFKIYRGSSFMGSIGESCSSGFAMGGFIGQIASDAGDPVMVVVDNSYTIGNVSGSYGSCGGAIAAGTDDVVAVGGIFGLSASTENDLSIKKTYSRGEITLDEATQNSLNRKAAFVGNTAANEVSSAYANYHFGESDGVAAKPFGDEFNVSFAIPGRSSIVGNIRNDVDGLVADGEFSKYSIVLGLIKRDNGTYLNDGVISSAEMQSRAFAHGLNVIGELKGDLDGAAWVFDNEDNSERDSLPRFLRAYESSKPTRMVSFMLPNTVNLTDKEIAGLKKFETEEVAGEVYYYAFTRQEGFVDAAWGEYADSLASAKTGRLWKFEGDAPAIRFAPRAEYDRDVGYVLKDAQTFSIKYFVADGNNYVPMDEYMENSGDQIFLSKNVQNFVEGDTLTLTPFMHSVDATGRSSFRLVGFLKGDGVSSYESNGIFAFGYDENGDFLPDGYDMVDYNKDFPASLDSVLAVMQNEISFDGSTISLVYEKEGTAPVVTFYFNDIIDYSVENAVVAAMGYDAKNKKEAELDKLTITGDAAVAAPTLPQGFKYQLSLPEIPESVGRIIKGWQARVAIAKSIGMEQIFEDGYALQPEQSMSLYVDDMIYDNKSGSYAYHYLPVDVSDELDLDDLVSEMYRKFERMNDVNDYSIAVYLTPVYEAIEYEFTLDVNTTEPYFAGESWLFSTTVTMDEASITLPEFYRVDACMEGWTVANQNSPVSKLSADFLANLIDANPDETHFTLKASWTDKAADGSDCTSDDNLMKVTATSDGHGGLKFVQYSSDWSDSLVHYFEPTSAEKTEYELVLPTRGYNGNANMTFRIMGAPDAGYALRELTSEDIDDLEEGREFRTTGTFVSQFDVKYIFAGPYNVVLDMTPYSDRDGTGKNEVLDIDASKRVFASVKGTNVLPTEYGAIINEPLPLIYTLDGYITSRWSPADVTEYVEGGDYYSLELHNVMAQTKNDTLRSRWYDMGGVEEAYYMLTTSVKNASVSLAQKIGADSISTKLSSEAIYIPRVNDGLSFAFALNVEPEDGLDLVGDINVVISSIGYGRKTGEEITIDDTISYKNGEVFVLPAFANDQDVEIFRYAVSVEAEVASVKTVALNENSTEKSLFYGTDWVQNVEILASENNKDEIELPEIVYTSNSCVLGWAPAATGSKMSFANGSVAGDVWMALAEQKNPTLYGVWGEAKACADSKLYDLISLKMKSESGSVELLEIRKGKDKIDTIHHAFAKDNTILIPAGREGDFIVSAKSTEDSVVVDSIVVTVLDANGKAKDVILKNGSALPSGLNGAVIAPVYVDMRTDPEEPDVDTTAVEFTLAKVYPSGNAVRFSYEISPYKASDSAVVRLILEDDDGIVGDTLVLVSGDSVSGYRSSWEKFPLKPGNYLLTVELVDGDSSAHFEQDFEVARAFAGVKDGEWTMISMGFVDMDSITWDDDVRFYWWDESRNYGAFWQYQEFTESSVPEMERGYWYSSNEGRSLVLKGSPVAETKGEWKLDSIYSGWNQVANPYGWYVDLCEEERCAGEDEKSDVAFYRWNASVGGYEPVTVLKPYEAVWAKASGSRTWKLPSKPTFVEEVDEDGEVKASPEAKKAAPAAKAAVLAKAKAVNNWSLQVALADERGKRDGWNVIGVGAEAWNAEEPPEGMGDHVNLSIMEGKVGLNRSFKKAAAGNAYEWTVELSASSRRAGYLSVAGANELRAYGLKVFVTVDGETKELSDGERMKVALSKTAKQATVRVAESAAKVVAYRIDGLKAVQNAGNLQVSFNATEGLAGSVAHVDLMDIKGHVMASASARTLAGENLMTLGLPKSGLYLFRVRAGSQMSAGRIMVK